jgi:exodeoxyribonuclease V beta subunit
LEQPKLVLRQFRGSIENDFRITSFSSLTARKDNTTEEADRDRLLKRMDSENHDGPDMKSLFSFPRGARAGTFMHEIFEKIDFSVQNGEIERHVSKAIERYGYDHKWDDPVTEMVNRVLNVPLYDMDQEFTLSRIQPRDRMNELEFCFPIGLLRPEDVENVFSRHGIIGYQDIKDNGFRNGRLEFSPVKGRSEERRVGKECRRLCRSRWSPYH